MYIYVTGVLDKVPNTIFTKRKKEKGLWKTVTPVTLVPQHCFTEEGPPASTGRLNCSEVCGTLLAQFTRESQSGGGGGRKRDGLFIHFFVYFISTQTDIDT